MCLYACPYAFSFFLFSNFTLVASNLSWTLNARCFLNEMLAPRWQNPGLNLLITLAVLLKAPLLVNHNRPASFIPSVNWLRSGKEKHILQNPIGYHLLRNSWEIPEGWRVIFPGSFGLVWLCGDFFQRNVLDYILGCLYLSAFNFLTPLKSHWTLENFLREIHTCKIKIRSFGS